jgi:hypothetical protein
MTFDGDKIFATFEKNLKQAKNHLSKLSIFCGRDASFAGLGGWVFEQTIQHCIRKELSAKLIKASVDEQVSLGGRAKADLLVGSIAIEIKSGGLFGATDIDRYRKYRKAAKAKGYKYIFISREETYKPYRDAIIKALGKKNVFFLNKPGEWHRVIDFLTFQLKPSRK